MFLDTVKKMLRKQASISKTVLKEVSTSLVQWLQKIIAIGCPSTLMR